MAGFLDRAKESAQRAMSESKHKVDEFQEKRAGQELVRKLGEAYYAAQRGQGSQQAVDEAKRVLDDYVRVHGDSFLHQR
ncbi:hypothetical protein GCM10027168_27960 [Streptomyces capparidis]